MTSLLPCLIATRFASGPNCGLSILPFGRIAEGTVASISKSELPAVESV